MISTDKISKELGDEIMDLPGNLAPIFWLVLSGCNSPDGGNSFGLWANLGLAASNRDQLVADSFVA